MIVSQEEFKRYASKYNNHGDAIIYADSKDGATNLMMAGDGVALFVAMYATMKRIGQIADMPFEDVVEAIVILNEISDSEVVSDDSGVLQPFEKTAEQVRFEKTLEEVRHEAAVKVGDAETRLEEERLALRTHLAAVRDTYQRQIDGYEKKVKALNKEIRQKESEIRRYEKLIKGRGASGA